MNERVKDTGTQLRCHRCFELKLYHEFRTSSSSKKFKCLDGIIRSRECKTCSAIRFQEADPRRKLLWPATKRAKEQGIPCTITVEDIVIPELCPLLGIPLERGQGVAGAIAASPSLDRMNPELGYVPGNVAVISRKANLMKNDASSEELLAFAKNIANYLANGTDNEAISRPYRNQESGRLETVS